MHTTFALADAPTRLAIAAQRKARAAGEEDDDEGAADAPRKWEDYSVKFAFPTPTELPPPLIQLIDVGFRYPGRDDFGLKNVNLGVDMGTRVAIVGPNGAGKSTLLNLLAGDLEPTEGEFRKSHKLRIGRYSQHFVDILQMDESAVEYLLRLFPAAGLKPEGMRALLGRFGLEGHNHLSPIIKLSGGQKARVVFAAISLAAPHILLMDGACRAPAACSLPPSMIPDLTPDPPSTPFPSLCFFRADEPFGHAVHRRARGGAGGVPGRRGARQPRLAPHQPRVRGRDSVADLGRRQRRGAC